MPNQVVIEGNLGADPEQSGNGPVTFNICWNARKKDDNGEWTSTPNWFTVKSWEREKVAAAGLTKGTRVLVTGRLVQEQWEKDGQKHSKVVVVADRDGIATSLPFVERDTPDW